MRRVYPLPAEEVGLFEAYGRLEGGARDGTVGRPAVRANMIASADGAASLDGRTVGLGGPEDRALLSALRSLADVVLVGASTARAENYGPARLTPDLRDRREAAGWTAVPPIAVVTRTCRLDWTSKLFTDAEQHTIVITTELAAADHAGDRARAEEVATLLVAGEEDVSMPAALAGLAERGYKSVLAEGGPSILAQLSAADLVDELCLTVAPAMVPTPAGRIVATQGSAPPVALELAHVLVGDEHLGGYLFLRYGRRPDVSDEGV